MSNQLIGATAKIKKAITAEDIMIFSELSMDSNPIHLNEEYASQTKFGKRIAHGYYVASFISAAIAGKLPGPGSIYISQELKFKAPVYIGDTITAVVTIVDVPKPSIYRLSTQCFNQDNVLVIDGTAVIKNDEVSGHE